MGFLNAGKYIQNKLINIFFFFGSWCLEYEYNQVVHAKPSQCLLRADPSLSTTFDNRYDLNVQFQVEIKNAIFISINIYIYKQIRLFSIIICFLQI